MSFGLELEPFSPHFRGGFFVSFALRLVPNLQAPIELAAHILHFLVVVFKPDQLVFVDAHIVSETTTSRSVLVFSATMFDVHKTVVPTSCLY